MRIAMIGDLQYAPGEEEQIEKRLIEIRNLKPDLAVSMGDMGASGKTGSEEGMRACARLLEQLGCRVIPLLGNHDVEYRPDDPFIRTPDIWYRTVFHREDPWELLDFGNVMLLCLSVVRQPEETLVTQHALYASDAQYGFALRALKEHPDKPFILLSHSPMAGSGLRNCPYVHGAATDTYMDQSFEPLRWKELIRQFPSIRLWGSAHFHMGHDYESSVTFRDNVFHVSGGVLTSCSRDGDLQTRILDVEDGRIQVLTYDHNTHALTPDLRIPLDPALPAEGHYAEPAVNEILIGEDTPAAVIRCPELHRSYIRTEYGKLWEFDETLQDLTGCIFRKTPVSSAAFRNGRLFFRTADGCFSVDPLDRHRFEIRAAYAPQAIRRETFFPEDTLCEVPFTSFTSRAGTHIRF